MRRSTPVFLIIALAGAGSSTLVSAQMDHSAHGMAPAKSAMVMNETALQEGVVKKIDKTAGKVSVAHEAQKNGMPAMTMVYKVKDAAALNSMQNGQKIRFATDPADAMTIVRVESTK